MLPESCDIVWSCASETVRDIVGRRSKLQIGVSIPVFALTDEGKRLILNGAEHFQGSPCYAPGKSAAGTASKAARASDLIGHATLDPITRLVSGANG